MLQQRLDPNPLPGPVPPPMQVQQQPQAMPPRGSQNAPFELGIASMPGPPQMQDAMMQPMQMQPYRQALGPGPMSASSPSIQAGQTDPLEMPIEQLRRQQMIQKLMALQAQPQQRTSHAALSGLGFGGV